MIVHLLLVVEPVTFIAFYSAIWAQFAFKFMLLELLVDPLQGSRSHGEGILDQRAGEFAASSIVPAFDPYFEFANHLIQLAYQLVIFHFIIDFWRELFAAWTKFACTIHVLCNARFAKIGAACMTNLGRSGHV